MKRLVLIFFSCLYIQADTYTIEWQKNDQVDHYLMDVLCINTSFSKMKRYGSDSTSSEIELDSGLTYQITLYASSKYGGIYPSNTLTIKTANAKLPPKFKPPQIKATKK